MKKKMIGRVSALTVAGVMMFGGMQIPAMAATGDSVVQFQKVLQMENAEGANVPNVTYTYTITETALHVSFRYLCQTYLWQH